MKRLVSKPHNEFDAAWEKGFFALEAFKRKHGHFLVPRFHVAGTYRLGQWVAVQRYTKDALSPDRKSRLDKIGFIWSQLDWLWEQNFVALKAFKRRYGNCRVPAGYTDGKLKLGLWVATQRRKKSKMRQDAGRGSTTSDLFGEPGK